MSTLDRNTHFEFGANWQDFSKTVNQVRIDSAIAGMKKLFPGGLHGKTFLDIGCGSGLHSIAALSLGASSVVATDIDENSVATTRSMLSKYAQNSTWTAREVSVFDLTSDRDGLFDVVYSWGVLHHTGDLWRAIDVASRLVRQGGEFAIAIYGSTAFDGMWKAEKRFYSKAPAFAQATMRSIFVSAFLVRMAAAGQSPSAYLKNYLNQRGMSFSHDVHDWLGGYPYEPASTEEVRAALAKLGFEEKNSFTVPKTIGLFGSGCNEFVFRKQTGS